MSRNNRKEEKDSDESAKKSNKTRSKTWIYLYIACLIFVVISRAVPILADIYIDSVMDDMNDEYTYHLRFPRNGYQSHYYIERWNTSAYGIIDLTYHTPTHTLDVQTANLKVLGINSRSMYVDECKKITGRNPYDDSNLYKKYFIERDLFSVNIITMDNRPIENLSFTDMPIAYEVRVDGKTWNEGEGYYYTPEFDMVIGNVPSGTTHVELWFKSPGNTGPTAIIDNNEITVEVNETIIFDASSSNDDVGIEFYHWDFGDGNFSSENDPITIYSYPEVGVYEVILTVRDADLLIDTAYITVTVLPHTGNNPPAISGIVPNQEKDEDSPPWVLDLSGYGYDVEDSEDNLKWFITGENTSLYTLVGENLTNILTFIPFPHTSGNNKVTLWLEDTSGDRDSQPLWINITPINDAPCFNPQPPNLYVHYDDPNTDYDDPTPWDYKFYVHDSDTPLKELFITTSESKVDSGEGYVEEDGLNVTFHYPQSMVGESFPVILTLSDGVNNVKTMIIVNVTSDWVPELVKKIPDVVLEENTTLYNVFDLDDYFVDRDHDTLYFSSGYFNLRVDIQDNNSVDITAMGHWTGSEFVTFRAKDPIGAIVEDTITVKVVPVNDPPVIAGVPDFVVHYDYPYTFDLSWYITDSDNFHSELRVLTSEPTSNIWIQPQNNLGIVVNYPESMLGMTIPVTIFVSDGIEMGSQEIQISVTDDHPPELNYNLPDVSFDEDTVLENAFNLGDYFYDMDGDALYYTNGTKFISAIINDDDTVDFYAPENWYGFEYITFRATDPYGALAEDKILVVVLPVNDAPVIREIPKHDMIVGKPWILDLSQYIEDVDNDITELEITAESEVGQDYVILAGTILTFQYPEGVHNDIITVTASDGELETSRSLTIGDPSPIPVAPSIWDLIPWSWLFFFLFVLVAGAFAFYKRKRRFWVYDVFLIHENGLPIAHISRRESSELEDVVVSGMFTAVQDFITNAFSGETDYDWEVDVMKFGDNQILIERSPNLYLAVIFWGNGRTLRSRVKKAISNINDEYGDVLENWDGDLDQLKGIKELIAGSISKRPGKDFELGDTTVQLQSEPLGEDLDNAATDGEDRPEDTVCPECGTRMSKEDSRCPECGFENIRRKSCSLSNP
ncbi:MAG: PKD domain-containing protein [Thermoplasmata archaeon]|nr:MAG: PKD domain-containing protein [Thermoplasmata archaeon]